MGYRNLLVSAVLATGLAGLAWAPKSSWAETIAVDNGIAVKESDVATPGRGMTMDQVMTKFGEPTNKIPAVGQPPISRWDYPGFVVYFERNHVIHSVVANS
jgi:outer membrane protein assembly factor BamE (lipoprotein component of BamABCDE complex)